MKKRLGIVLALVISFSPVFSVRASNIEGSEKKLNDLNNSIKQNKDKLNTINKNKEDLENQLKGIDEKLNSTSKSLTDLNKKITSLDSQLKDVEKQIKECESELSKKNVLLKDRVRAMYTSGNTAYLEVLLGSDDFSDLVNRIEWVTRIVEHDKKLISTIEKNKKTVESKKIEFEDKRKQFAEFKKKYDNEYKVLQGKSSEKKQVVTTLQKDKSYYEKMIAEEEAQSSNITDMIKKMKEQSKPKPGGNSTNNNSTTVKPTNGKYACVTGGVYGITSSYGWRVHPVLGNQRFHSGIDIGVPSGTSIYALTSGVVVYSGWMSGYGNVVMINHGNIISLYAHNSVLCVSEGQTVKAGQLITHSGNTGLSSGPHLHFEIRQADSGETIDPTGYYVR